MTIYQKPKGKNCELLSATSRHDNQPIIDEGMGRDDHQTPQKIGTKCGTSNVMAISPIEHVTFLNQLLF